MQRCARSTALVAAEGATSSGSYCALVFKGSNRRRSESDLGAVLAGLAQQNQHLIVTLAGGPLTETGTAHSVRGVDRRVDRQTRRGDETPGVELAGRRGRELARLLLVVSSRNFERRLFDRAERFVREGHACWIRNYATAIPYGDEPPVYVKIQAARRMVEIGMAPWSVSGPRCGPDRDARVVQSVIVGRVPPTSYVRRLLDDQLSDLLAAHPAILLVGPRAAGKTTTARRYAASVVRLDRPAEAAAFAADPDAALARLDGPVLLDEWQAVPDVLGAVKRAVDDDGRPGRFLLTGSVRADLDAQTWPGTGRLIRVSLHGLNQREVATAASLRNPIDVLAEGDPMALGEPVSAPDLPGYISLALRGGFPEATLRLDGRERDRWLESYLDQILTRDAVGLSGRDPTRMARYFEVLALNSAGIVADSTIYEAAGIDRKTALAYERLLTNLFLLDVVPAWLTNRLSRLVKTPKRYVTDPSLIGAALRADVSTVMRDGDLMGRMLDTFVAAQLRPEVEVSAQRPRLFHLRDKNGRHEIDLLAELGGDRVVAVEVKASASPARRDAAHLEWLRDHLGARFLSGAVLHTGPRAFPLGDRIAAVPIAALWSTNRR